MKVRQYQELLVWQKSMDLVEEVYELIRLLPKEEIYALSNQLRRSVVSVPSNIAEGQSRNSTKEFTNFLSIAKGSLSEVETQLLICTRLNYLSYEQIEKSMSLCSETGKMINGLLQKLKQ